MAAERHAHAKTPTPVPLPWNTWRSEALDTFVKAVALALALSVAGLAAFRTVHHSPLFRAAAGAALLMIALWVGRRWLPFGVRASFALGAVAFIGLLGIAWFGFAAGPVTTLAVVIMLATVLFGRAAAFLLMVISASAVLLIDWARRNGQFPDAVDQLDPLALEAIVPMLAIFIAALTCLVVVVDQVVRRLGTRYARAGEAREEIARLTRRLETEREDDRRLLANALSEIGQSLTALKLRTQLATRAAEAPAGFARQSEELVGMVDTLIERTRRMSVDLRPLMLEELGLQPALRALVEGLVGSSGISFGFQSTGPTDRLPPDIELACYRVAKEAVTNVVRHSEATRLVVRLERHPQKIDLIIRDDGKGFQPDRVSGPHFTLEHLGLVAMRERARALGGSFSVSTAPGQGTSILLTLPSPEGKATPRPGSLASPLPVDEGSPAAMSS